MYDPTQPRVPKGHSHGGEWTSGDYGQPSAAEAQNDSSRPLSDLGKHRMHAAVHAPAIYAAQAAFAGLRAAIRGGQLLVQTGFAAGLAYFAQLSARNSPDRRAALAFRARAFPGADGELVLQGIRELTAEEVGEVCEAYGTVQGKTNEAVLLAGPKGGRSPTVYGTHVHYELQELIKALGNPNLKAEQSVLKRMKRPDMGAPDQFGSTCSNSPKTRRYVYMTSKRARVAGVASVPPACSRSHTRSSRHTDQNSSSSS
jgi:hypothetical protein